MRLDKTTAYALVFACLIGLVGTGLWCHYDPTNLVPYICAGLLFAFCYAGQFAVARIEVQEEFRNSPQLAAFQAQQDQLGRDYDDLVEDFYEATQVIGEWQLYAERLTSLLQEFKKIYGDTNPTHAYLLQAHALVVRLMTYPDRLRRALEAGSSPAPLDPNFVHLAETLIDAALTCERLRTGLADPGTEESEFAIELAVALHEVMDSLEQGALFHSPRALGCFGSV